jgi:hypothetical protein
MLIDAQRSGDRIILKCIVFRKLHKGPKKLEINAIRNSYISKLLNTGPGAAHAPSASPPRTNQDSSASIHGSTQPIKSDFSGVVPVRALPVLAVTKKRRSDEKVPCSSVNQRGCSQDFKSMSVVGVATRGFIWLATLLPFRVGFMSPSSEETVKKKQVSFDLSKNKTYLPSRKVARQSSRPARDNLPPAITQPLDPDARTCLLPEPSGSSGC